MPKKATNIGLPEQLNIMLYGDMGSGKTTFATTFPKPILFFDIDNRYQTYAGVDGIEYETYKDEPKRPRAYRDFYKDLRKYAKELKYATVVLDSTTTLLDIMKSDLLGTGTGSGATEGLSLPQWGTAVSRFEKIFNTFRSYDAHKIVISHQQMIKDDVSGEIMMVTMMVGKKFPQKAPIFFDEIYRCYSEEVRLGRNEREKQYLIQTQSDRRFPARSSLNLRDNQSQVVPILNQTEPQDFNTIMDKVKSARKDPKAYIKKVKAEREE